MTARPQANCQTFKACYRTDCIEKGCQCTSLAGGHGLSTDAAGNWTTRLADAVSDGDGDLGSIRFPTKREPDDRAG